MKIYEGIIIWRARGEYQMLTIQMENSTHQHVLGCSRIETWPWGTCPSWRPATRTWRRWSRRGLHRRDSRTCPGSLPTASASWRWLSSVDDATAFISVSRAEVVWSIYGSYPAITIGRYQRSHFVSFVVVAMLQFPMRDPKWWWSSCKAPPFQQSFSSHAIYTWKHTGSNNWNSCF